MGILIYENGTKYSSSSLCNYNLSENLAEKNNRRKERLFRESNYWLIDRLGFGPEIIILD